MKTAKIITTFVLLIAMTSMAFGQITNTKPITFKKDEFDRSLTRAVEPQVKGYQYVLIKDGKVVTEKAGGFARNAADGSAAMTTTTPTNIGSLAKFMSGTALLGLMQKPTPYSPDKGKSLQQRLDKKIVDLFPNVWKNGATKGVENISMRQLLQHRTGFDNDKPSNRSVYGFLKDADGFNQAKFNTREYNNVNFALVGYMIPLYSDPNLIGGYNGANLSDKVMRNSLGKNMDDFMRARYWNQMTPKISPNCDAANTLKTSAAYGYQSKADVAKGAINSAINSDGHCLGHGGYYLSSRDFANYMAHFSQSDLIVNKTGRDMMYTEGVAPNDRLVWSSASNDSWMNKNFKMPTVVWSNGITGGYKSVVVRLPQNHYLVLFTNSPELDVASLYTAGVDAFKAGMQHNF